MCSSETKTPAPPTATKPTKATQACPKCCCCVNSVSIGNVRFTAATPLPIPSASWTLYNGHAFDFTIQMGFCNGATGTADCTLEWWEKVNAGGIPGAPLNAWTDMYAQFTTSPTFAPWKNRTVPCPGGGSLTVMIVDVPQLGAQPGLTMTRNLEFRLVVRSGAGCTCTHTSATATATQVLTMVNGNLVTASCSFTIGPTSTTP